MLLFGFVCIDVGRLLYTYAAISNAAGEGARTVSLQASANSDCLALQRMLSVAQGFNLNVDPGSLAGNTDPNNPTGSLQPTQTPAPNQGYIYIWPAVATAQPQTSNCDGAQRQVPQTPTGVRNVAVEIQFRFQPLTPLPNANLIVRSLSTQQTEYGT